MYSQTTWTHAQNPNNRGRLPEPTTVGESRYPKCGDRLQLFLLLDGERITQATFEAHACAPVIAIGSVGTQLLHGKTPTEARQIGALQLDEAVDKLPGPKRHAIWMFLEALHRALDALENQEV